MPAKRDGAPHTPSASAQRDHVERLRRLGVRVTPQRLLVLDALAAHEGHMTAEAILQRGAEHYPALNLATVYRTLDLLIALGLVTQTDLGTGVAHYELAGDAPHHHLVCEQCGAMSEVDDSLLWSLRDELLARYGFAANPRHVALFGLCRACREQADALPSSEP